jgi:integrase
MVKYTLMCVLCHKSGATMSNKKNKSGYKVRGNKLYVQGSVDGEFKVYSTGMEATKENERWLAKNAIKEFYKIHESKTKKEMISTKFVPYALLKLDLLKDKVKESTQKEYIQIFNTKIKDQFEPYDLTDIKRYDLQLWQKSLVDDGLSPKRINNIRSVFNIILEEARKDELIEKNYFDSIDREKLQKVDINPFSLDEVKLLLDKMPECQEKYFIQLAFFTGMRTGEIVALKWDDVNWINETINIRSAVRKGKLGSTKTDNSNRVIDILPPAMDALMKMKNKTYLRNSFIFLNGSTDSHFHDGSWIRKGIWSNTLKLVGLDYRTLYQTRHTFASLMISKGEDILWVSNMLGHANSQVTLTRYAKYIKTDKKRRATFLDDEFSSSKLDKNLTATNLRFKKVS